MYTEVLHVDLKDQYDNIHSYAESPLRYGTAWLNVRGEIKNVKVLLIFLSVDVECSSCKYPHEDTVDHYIWTSSLVARGSSQVQMKMMFLRRL